MGISEVKYLGHVVSKGKVAVDDSKIFAIHDWPEPTTQKGVKSFLGLANHYNHFIDSFAEMAAPLSSF
jgi:hypothetical protein